MIKKIKKQIIKAFRKKSVFLVLRILLFLNLFVVGVFLGFYFAKKVALKTSLQKNFSSIQAPSFNNESFKPGTISSEEIYQKYQQGEKIIFVDTRSFEEYQKEHIKGAIWTGTENIQEKTKFLSKEDFLVTYCYGSMCGPAKTVAFKLSSLGFKNVFFSGLSVEKWKKLGGETEGKK